MRTHHLYLDTLKRLSLKQIYFFLLNRVLNKHFKFPQKNRKISEEPALVIESTYNKRLKRRIENIFVQILEYKTNEKNKTCSYIEYVERVADEYVRTKRKDVLHDLWIHAEDDQEKKANFQKFYLFDAVIKKKSELNHSVPPLIQAWIESSSAAENDWDSLTCALRLINWMKLLYYTPEESYPDRHCWTKVLQSIKTQTSFLLKHIEYEVDGNHVLLELISIWLIINIFPEIGIEKNSATLEASISREICKQFGAEGFHCEHSLHYHIQTTLAAMYWLSWMIAFRKPVKKAVQDKLYQASTQINNFILPDGSVPILGDCCYPFFHSSVEEDVGMLRLLSKTLLKPVTGSGVNDKKTNHYVVYKTEAETLIVDVGGIGYDRNPGHGHSDVFSFIYCSKGKIIFTDPGTRRYDSAYESMRLKKACYHNTLSINRADHARLWGYFRWAFLPKKVTSTCIRTETGFELDGLFISAKQLGTYQHKRKITLNDHQLTISDRVMVSGKNDIFVNFILHPDITADVEKTGTKLSACGHRWFLKILSPGKHLITLHDISVYPAYNLAVPSKKIEILFPGVFTPFNSTIEISYHEAK